MTLPPLTHRIAEGCGPGVRRSVRSSRSREDPLDKQSLRRLRAFRADTRQAKGGNGPASHCPGPSESERRSLSRSEPRRPGAAHQAASTTQRVGSSSAAPSDVRGCGQVLPALEQDHATSRRWWCDTCRARAPRRARRSDAKSGKRRPRAASCRDGRTPVVHRRSPRTTPGDEPASTARPACLGSQPRRASPDVEWYSEHIAPRLADFSLIEIAGALGVSTSSASKFRRGLRVPAPRYWSFLARLVGTGQPAGGELRT
jgi:hypothetical protein